MREMEGWKIGLLVASGILALGACCVCGGMFWLVQSTGDMDQALAEGQRRGQQAGQQGTLDECVQLGFARYQQCTVSDLFSCQEGAEAFTSACLNAVPNPDPGFCSSVGAPADVLDLDFEDEDRFCRHHNLPTGDEDMACDRVAEVVELYCSVR